MGISSFLSRGGRTIPLDELEDQLGDDGIGGGGSQPVHSIVQTVLTDAQIKTLPSIPVEIVPAPGANKLAFFSAAVIGPLIGTAYNTVDSGAIGVIFYGTGPRQVSRSWDASPNIFGGLKNILQLGPVWGSGDEQDETNAAVNVPLSLSIDNNGAGNFGGGGVNNMLPVSVIYAVVDLSA